MAGGLGFEPRLAESESAVLPLDDPPPARYVAPRLRPCKPREARSAVRRSSRSEAGLARHRREGRLLLPLPRRPLRRRGFRRAARVELGAHLGDIGLQRRLHVGKSLREARLEIRHLPSELCLDGRLVLRRARVPFQRGQLGPDPAVGEGEQEKDRGEKREHAPLIGAPAQGLAQSGMGHVPRGTGEVLQLRRKLVPRSRLDFVCHRCPSMRQPRKHSTRRSGRR